MIIPKLHYIAQGETKKELLENIQKACTSGAELVELRMENASENKVLKVAKEAIKITEHFQTRLIISGHYKIAKEIKADGVHLEKTDVAPTVVRKHLYPWQSIGGTANTLADCENLLDEEIDYITLGPFRETSTKVDLGPVLGLKGYTAITDILKTPIPIIGFGGITTEDITDILQTGISGVAVSEAITQNFDSIKTFNQLLKASSTEEQRHTFE
ncbi:thiamine phosphate synthase [Bizionia arctica]|uniref:Thiamine-phosphate synthase n=1 Tax=Bizionia arctica TaxID=1495645 RepID=A0A917GIX8_9FLAO|nr:thiamine phosphate synthase [Bizionia arctica]GGG47551.1 thiamine-phosphate synthase [Bizionia arctica]